MQEDQLLAELIAKAIQPLQDRISGLEATIAHLTDNQEIQLKLINNLRETARKEPQPTQRDRADVLRALLVANGGKMLAKEARQKMHLSKSRFSELISVCDFIETKPLHTDRRKMIIILKSELVPRN